MNKERERTTFGGGYIRVSRINLQSLTILKNESGLNSINEVLTLFIKRTDKRKIEG